MDIGHILQQVLLPKLEGVKNVGGYFIAKCPAHEDHNPSLSIRPGSVQPVVLNCHAGCATEDILAALDLTWKDISLPESDQRKSQDDDWTPAGPASDVYDYRDEQGVLLFQVLRIPLAGGGKTFRQRVPDLTSKAGWRWKLDTPHVKVRRVLYRLPQLIAALEQGETVWIAEGEKDVHALLDQNVVATCNPGGAGKWLDEFTDQFVGATIRIIADADRPGQAHARQVAADLAEIALSVTTVESGTHKDVAEHLAAGKTLDDLLITWSTQEITGRLGGTQRAPDLHAFLGVSDPPVSWVIPGLLERGDRLVWTGFEGLGKSVCVRQIAVAAAAGAHPFKHETFTPQRVLFIDCENSERQGRRHFRKLEYAARMKGRRVPEDQLFLIHRPVGIDLTKPEDAAWLLERITAHEPDLLVCGPFYRLHGGDSEEEKGARRVVAALDTARVKADCALIVEHHAPHGSGGAQRSVRPFGSSLLLRWPEMGMGIMDNSEDWPCRNVVVTPWRGNRDERDWPRALKWGESDNEWPWIVDREVGEQPR